MCNLFRILLSGTMTLILSLANNYTIVKSQTINSIGSKQIKRVEFKLPQASDEDEATSFEGDGKPPDTAEGTGSR